MIGFGCIKTGGETEQRAFAVSASQEVRRTMRTLFLSSNGLNERTAELFWECIGKEPRHTKVIFVPTAAFGSDSAREGIIVCLERLQSMGIAVSNILIYDLALLLFPTDTKGHIPVM